MVVLFSSKAGLPIEEFLSRYNVAGKNILYAVGNRIPSDRHRMKIGKSYSGQNRLNAYRNMYGGQSRTDKTSGAIIYRAEVVKAKPEGFVGKGLVDVKEDNIKKQLGPPVQGRGSEWFETSYEKMVRTFENAPKSTRYVEPRSTDRVGTCPEVCRARDDKKPTRVVDGDVVHVLTVRKK